MQNFLGKGILKNIANLKSEIFCNASINSWIESVNYSKQIDLYIFGKDANLSEWNNAIKDFENERSRCRDFHP